MADTLPVPADLSYDTGRSATWRFASISDAPSFRPADTSRNLYTYTVLALLTSSLPGPGGQRLS